MTQKNTILLVIIICFFNVYVSSLNAQNSNYISVSDLLVFLSENHNVFFTYNPEVIKNSNLKKIDFEKLSLRESINILKNNTALKVESLGNSYYVIFKKEYQIEQILAKNKNAPFNKKIIDSLRNEKASEKKLILIKGTVLDQFDYPVEKASIIEKKTQRGTVTDKNGNFELKIIPETPIEISHISHGKKLVYPTKKKITIRLQSGVKLDEVLVVGSRNNTRQKIDAPVSTDVIDIKNTESKSEFIQINQLIQNEIPSFNATKQSGSDGSDHIIPATYRGLGPDQTLVLINGKRRHQASLINLYGTRGRGNSGTDLNAIPTSAIKRIEILKDGASAQYGSDAIAGVINIVLKDQPNKTQINTTFGFNNASNNTNKNRRGIDGLLYKADVNYGTKIGTKGFLNLSAELLSKDYTFRRGTDIRENYGDPATKTNSLFFNSEIPLSKNTKFYANGGYNFKDTRAYAFTRPAENERNIPEIYPTGFNPIITSNISDKSLTIGSKGNFYNWNVDLSNTIGINHFQYFIRETLNASLLDKSPKKFNAGGHNLIQNTTNLDISRHYKNFLNGLNIAAGFENRFENYQIFSGEEASYAVYDINGNLVTASTPCNLLHTHNGKIRPGGSQGFPGYSPKNEVDKMRTSVSLYFDSEIDFTKKWLLATAMRYENYSDFGSSINTKIATRYKISPKAKLRFSYSTGFRAPSLAQIYYNLKFTNFIDNKATESFLIANNNPITKKFGISNLKEEKAVNYSLGFNYNLFKNLNFSFDSYHILIKDRIILSGNFDASEIDSKVTNVQFFANGVNTSTIGFDFRLGWKKYFNNSKLNIDIVGNVNKMNITKINNKTLDKNNFFGLREQYFLLASAPNHKLILNAVYSLKNFTVSTTLTRFSSVELIDWQILKENIPFKSSIDYYQGKYTSDIHLTFKLYNNFSIHSGVNNLFNTYPTEQARNTDSGGLWDAIQMGTNGAFYYTKFLIKL